MHISKKSSTFAAETEQLLQPNATMETHIFKRKAYDKMLAWKRNSNGHSALLVEGARRVGKSTLVEQFAKNEYRSYLLIDFNNTDAAVKEWFSQIQDMDYFLLRLQSFFNIRLYERQSVIIFDEVQQCPLARQAIKYLVSDGRYDYIETGSLISIQQSTKGITIPSEEERIEMFPMDYEEFLWAIGKNDTMPLLEQFFHKRLPLGTAHRAQARTLRLYMLVGGMPQAVNAYIETNNLQTVDTVKRQIIHLYENDFIKIDPSKRVSKMFMTLPAALSKNQSRYTPSSVVGRTTSDRLAKMLIALEDSKVVNIVYHADDPNVGLSLSADLSRYKLFVGDTGLFVTLVYWDKDYTENIIYQKLLSDKLATNLGYIYENLVAQMLRAAGNRLFYYTFPKDGKHNYEIDFLLSRGNKVVPIEVKSSDYRKHDSIDAFQEKFSSRIGQRYILHTKDLQREGDLLKLPVYMAGLL